jgi:xanthine dehydrogenase accessory factor
MISHSQMLAELLSLTMPAAICTVVHVKGSTPRKVGAKMLVIDNGEAFGKISGTIGGGAIEHHIRAQALDAIKEQEPRLIATSLRNELAMCCGGEMTVFIEPVLKTPELLCFGAGHIAQALCPLAQRLGFSVHVIDHREELSLLPCFDACQKHVVEINPFLFSALPFSPHVYVVIATHDHQLDQMVAEQALKIPGKYLALVGSERKALMTKKRLIAKGHALEMADKIICPAGIDIKAQTPFEIAISIVAQMVEIKNSQPNRLASSYKTHGENF